MGVKAVIFDLDDTLVYSGIDYKGMKRSLINFLVEAGVDPDLLSEEMPNIEIFRVALEHLRDRGLSEDKIKRIFGEANAILDRAEMESLGRARLMDGALEILKALKRLELKIGIVTNGCRRYAAEIIKVSSLDDYIDALIARDDVPSPKPSPDHLLKALEVLGVSAEEAIFVGDHWIDALCAKNAGIKFILFNNRGGCWEEIRGRDMAIATISDLRDITNFLPSGREMLERNNY